MAATCSTCATVAGPTIRVNVNTITHRSLALALTLEQALDLHQQLGREFATNNIPHHHIPE